METSLNSKILLQDFHLAPAGSKKTCFVCLGNGINDEYFPAKRKKSLDSRSVLERVSLFIFHFHFILNFFIQGNNSEHASVLQLAL